MYITKHAISGSGSSWDPHGHRALPRVGKAQSAPVKTGALYAQKVD